MEPISLIVGLISAFFISMSINKQDTLTDIANRNENKVYRLQVGERFIATGFALKTPNGTYLTSALHVCDTLELISRRVKTTAVNPKYKFDIKDIVYSKRGDVCLLNKLPDNTPAFELAKKLKPRADGWIVGFPAGRPLSVSHGLITDEVQSFVPAMRNIIEKCEGEAFRVMGSKTELTCAFSGPVLDTTIPAAPGNSGSPVVDKNNKVVGVASYIDTNTPFFLSIVPLRIVKDFINRKE